MNLPGYAFCAKCKENNFQSTGARKTERKTSQETAPATCGKMLQKSLILAPKTAPESLQNRSREAKEAQRDAKSRPREAKSDQERPKNVPRAISSKKEARGGVSDPRPGAHPPLDSPWSPGPLDFTRVLILRTRFPLSRDLPWWRFFPINTARARPPQGPRAPDLPASNPRRAASIVPLGRWGPPKAILEPFWWRPCGHQAPRASRKRCWLDFGGHFDSKNVVF